GGLQLATIRPPDHFHAPPKRSERMLSRARPERIRADIATRTWVASAYGPPSGGADPDMNLKKKSESMPSFEDLGLREELLRTLEEEDISDPTALQAAVIPALRRGGNFVAR